MLDFDVVLHAVFKISNQLFEAPLSKSSCNFDILNFFVDFDPVYSVHELLHLSYFEIIRFDSFNQNLGKITIFFINFLEHGNIITRSNIGC
jgi:hypothetical protein